LGVVLLFIIIIPEFGFDYKYEKLPESFIFRVVPITNI